MMTYNEQDAQAIIDFWRSKGLNDFAISAWLGNWYAESGLRSDNAQNSYMKKFGITDEEYCSEVNQGTWKRPASKDDPKAQAVRVSYAEEFFEKYFGSKKPTTNKVLAISAGHYLYTSGKRCLKSIDPTETREWVLNSRIADKLTVMLNRYEGIKIVRLDDPTGQKLIDLEARAKASDNNKADCYLAIHHNAGAKGTSAGGIVVYYYPKAVNKTAATKLYNLLIQYTGLKGNRSTPLKETKSLYEVKTPKAQSLLVENGFMDSTHDTPIILTEAHAEKTAQAMCEYFVSTWDLKLKEEESKSDILAEIESVKANIAALEERLKELEAML